MQLLYLVKLFMVVKGGIVDVKLLFNMFFCHFIHGVIESNVEWHADASFAMSIRWTSTA